MFKIHKFEAEVSDLQQRLREAEDKNKILKSKIEGHEVQGSALMKTKVSLLNIITIMVIEIKITTVIIIIIMFISIFIFIILII